jgi:uncharacterized protein YlzI (FlbEa/FlbD family)
MRKLLIFTILIFFPTFAIATDVEVSNRVDVNIGEQIVISKPLKKSTLKGFLEGEFGRIVFHIKISQIESVVHLNDTGLTLINGPPIYNKDKIRSVIYIKSSIMQYEQVIELIKSSESWW